MSVLKEKRSVIFPNPGFQRQLLDYEKKIIGEKKLTNEMRL